MSTAEAAGIASEAAPASFKLRLKAWWDGVDVAELRARPDADPDAGADDTRPVAGNQAEDSATEVDAGTALTTDLWPEERVAAIEALWGHGQVRPGGDTATLNFVRPIAMTPAMSIIDLRAGLGGTARALVDSYGLWIAGHEPSESLAEAGHERSIYAGMARKAPIQAYDPATIELKEGRYDAAIGFELFSHLRDKNGLFDRVVAALKESGQIMFTEFALKSHGEPSDALVAWREAEPGIADLRTLKEYREMCEDAGLDVRVCDDFSEDYRRIALTDWLVAVEQFRPGAQPPPVVAHMLDEAERWCARLAAIDSGDLRVIRIHALKKSNQSK